MKAVLCIFCLFFCVSCTSQTSNSPSQNKVTKSYFERDSLKTVYIFENDTLKQTIVLSRFNENEIDFKLISENKSRKQKALLEGIAKIKDGDVEIDEDSEGNAYPVNEYIYEKDCWLAFRIDRSTHERMRINEADCNQHSQYCPFASVDLLIKQ